MALSCSLALHPARTLFGSLFVSASLHFPPLSTMRSPRLSNRTASQIACVAFRLVKRRKWMGVFAGLFVGKEATGEDHIWHMRGKWYDSCGRWIDAPKAWAEQPLRRDRGGGAILTKSKSEIYVVFHQITCLGLFLVLSIT